MLSIRSLAVAFAVSSVAVVACGKKADPSVVVASCDLRHAGASGSALCMDVPREVSALGAARSHLRSRVLSA
jgi:hypothetical protein